MAKKSALQKIEDHEKALQNNAKAIFDTNKRNERTY